MALVNRPSKQSRWRLVNLLYPLLYLSIGALFGFLVCFSWLQEGRQPTRTFLSSLLLLDDALLAATTAQPPILTMPGIDEPKLIEPTTSSNSLLLQKDEDDHQHERNFFDIATRTGTDKVAGAAKLVGCLKDATQCTRPSCVNVKCRPWGHFYQTMYQSRLGHLSKNSTDPFQMLEIGFFHGRGYEAFREFFTNAEIHSLEISCLPKGKVEDGKWPHGNFAIRNKKWYSRLRGEHRLHCGDASNVDFLNQVWTTQMQRPDAPPLTLVIDDGSHLAKHMTQTIFYWFPRIEPGGYLVVEDIQPSKESNKFRTQFLPQLISDLHFCGDPNESKDAPCFPLLQQLLHSVHCELHICILQRNQEPAIQNLTLEESKPSRSALSLNGCRSLRESFGLGL